MRADLNLSRLDEGLMGATGDGDGIIAEAPLSLGAAADAREDEEAVASLEILAGGMFTSSPKSTTSSSDAAAAWAAAVAPSSSLLEMAGVGASLFGVARERFCMVFC